VASRQLSAECRLVFRTASLSCTAGEALLLAADVRDWPRAIALAELEMATSQVARFVLDSPRLPDDAREELRRRTLALDLRMQYLSKRVQQLCAAFAERAIPFMLLKGAALGAVADPTFVSRPMKDLDILVRHEDVGRASDAIIAMGWQTSDDKVLHDLLADAHHLPPFVDPRMPGIRIELHTAHLPAWHPFNFSVDDLWRDAVPARAPFEGAMVPSSEHLLLHAVMHFAWQHPLVFGAWRTFRLLSAIERDRDFDWLRFVAAAQSTRAVTASYWTLRLGSRLSGVEVRADILERLAPPTPLWVMSALERHFVASIALGESPSSPSVALDRRLWDMAIRPAWSGHTRQREWDPDNNWGRAYGIASNETALDRVVRHTRTYQRWTAFLSKTLFG
jgi:hypothetical protein